jgi:hypothetical protein
MRISVRSPNVVSVICLAALLAVPVSARAQSSGFGSIRGYVTDEQQGRLSGATLTVSNAGSGTPRTTTSDDDGHYRVPELPPGTYRVIAERAGFAVLTRNEVVVRAGLNLDLPLTMTLASQEQQVEVRGDAPMLEASTSVRTVNVSGEFQRALPLASRQNWYDFLTVTPGMVASGLDVGGFQSFFLHGSTNVAHVFQLDGADISTSYRSANSAYLMRMSSDSTDDVQIKTAALDASSPLGVGAMVNVVGQSGSNVPRGSASWTHRPRRWTGNNNPGGTTSVLDGSNVDLSFGGPLKRDHLWAFGSSRIVHLNEGISRTPAQIQLLTALNPAFEAFDNTVRGHAYYLKVTGQASPNHQVSLVTQDEHYDESTDINNYASRLRGVSWGGPFTTARLRSIWGASLTTTVTATHNRKGQRDFTLREDLPGVEIMAGVSPAGGRLVGTGRIALLDSVSFPSTNEPLTRTTFGVDATYYRSGLAGSHEVKAGLYLVPRNRMAARNHAHAAATPTVFAVLNDPANPAAGYTPYYRKTYDRADWEQLVVDQRNVALYIQDAWKPSSRLTVNGGVRIDRVVQNDRQFDTRVQDSTDVAPRIGINYALTSDGRDMLRASWGKVHDNLTTTVIGAGSNTVGFREEYDMDLNGTFETAFVTPGRTAISTDRIISDDYHQPYILEWTAGYQRQLPGRVTIEANVMRRAYRDYPVAIDTNGLYDGSVFVGYANPEFNQIVLVTPNRFYWPVYSGFDLQVGKQTAKLQLLASYARQWRHLEGSWAPNDPASFIQPDAFANDKGIGSTGSIPSVLTSGWNSLSGSAFTGYQGWRDHVVRVAASMEAPWQIKLASVYTFQSGVWSGPIVRRLAAGDPSFGPPTVTLPNGRLVTNPLSTVVRFANATAGEGQFTSDGVHTWNIRVGRQFSRWRWRLEPSLDVLNVVNAAAFQQFMGGANDQSNPNYRRQTNLQVPRQAMFSLRLDF